MRRLLEITTGRHPFQVATMAACPLAAVSVLITGQTPPSVAAALPYPFSVVWLYALAVAGLTAQLGTFWWGDLDTGLLLEAAGISLLATALSIYVLALLVVTGPPALAVAGFLLGLAVAGWWRVWQVFRDLRKVNRAKAEGFTASVRVLTERPGEPDDGSSTGPGAR